MFYLTAVSRPGQRFGGGKLEGWKGLALESVGRRNQFGKFHHIRVAGQQMAQPVGVKSQVAQAGVPDPGAAPQGFGILSHDHRQYIR